MYMYLSILFSIYNPTVKMPVKVLIDEGDMGSVTGICNWYPSTKTMDAILRDLCLIHSSLSKGINCPPDGLRSLVGGDSDLGLTCWYKGGDSCPGLDCWCKGGNSCLGLNCWCKGGDSCLGLT